MRIFCILIMALLLSSCGSLPSKEEIQSADYGKYPLEYEKIVKDFYVDRLKDPESARWHEIRPPKKGWLKVYSNTYYGWVVCGVYNAKNSYGAYVGRKTFAVVIRYDRVTMALGEDDAFTSTEACLSVYG